MRDLHDGFVAWIAAGGRDDLPRDVALHASGCEDCMRFAAAFDALLAVDPGTAPIPPLRAATASSALARPIRMARTAAGAMAIVLVLGAGAITGSALFGPRATEPPVSALEATPAEGILGGAPAPTPSFSLEASASASADPSPSPSRDVEPTAAVAAAKPRPTMGGGPPPISTAPPQTPTPRPATPGPTVAPTTAPTAGATPSHTAQPTPLPTPTPPPTPTPTPILTPTPTATPPEPECSNGLDDDGDGLTDFPLDPDCLSPGGEESGLLP